MFASSATLRAKLGDGAAGATLSFRIGQTPDLNFNTKVISGSPYLATGAQFETFEASATGLTPGSTYYYQALYNGAPSGEIMSFTTLREDSSFVALSNQPLPTVAICNESELACPPTVINPPAVSCADCDLSYTISSGVLPPGMSLDSSSGVISGYPSGNGGNYPFTLTVTSTSSDPSASPVIASQTYNLVTQPATAEPTVQNPAAGNVSIDSALITALGGFIPNGDLIRLVVRYTDSGQVSQSLLNEVIGEGNGSSNQLLSYDLKNLSPSTTYSYQVIFGNQKTDWFEFQTTATPTVPATATVAATTVSLVSDGTAELAATISNPLPGDAIGFVVGTNQTLSDGRTYLAGSAQSGTEQLVTTQISNLQPGSYFYRVLLGDGLSTLTYPFTIGSSGPGGGGSSGGGTSGGSSSGGSSSGSSSAEVTPEGSTTSSPVVKYRQVVRKFSFFFAGNATKLTKNQVAQLTKQVAALPKNRSAVRVTSVGWVSQPGRISERQLAATRARSVATFVRGEMEASVRSFGDRKAQNSSRSANRVDVWIAYKVPLN